MWNGLEVDVLSVGDADCIIVTRWVHSLPQRMLIDGGCGTDAGVVIDFLRARGYASFWVALCTHLHNDHASGLVKVIQNKSITVHNAWMHDIRKHVGIDALRRSCAADDGVRQVVETTKELASAFASRGVTPREPFAGELSLSFPGFTVLGPTRLFYRSLLQKLTNVPPVAPTLSPLWRAIALRGMEAPRRPGLAGLAPFPPPQRYANLSTLISPPRTPSSFVVPFSPLAGALNKSSVKQNPSTQPFNSTSVILGAIFNTDRLLFTADAGVDALNRVAPDWQHVTWMQVPHHGSDGNLSQNCIERFCPKVAYISACGDASHPSQAIVNGLIKVGSQVFSTHKANPGHLHYSIGSVPPRPDYGPAIPLKGTGDIKPLINWASILSGTR